MVSLKKLDLSTVLIGFNTAEVIHYGSKHHCTRSCRSHEIATLNTSLRICWIAVQKELKRHKQGQILLRYLKHFYVFCTLNTLRIQLRIIQEVYLIFLLFLVVSN